MNVSKRMCEVGTRGSRVAFHGGVGVGVEGEPMDGSLASLTCIFMVVRLYPVEEGSGSHEGGGSGYQRVGDALY